ncbi:hypothetical protein TRIUR3_33664 [Triticum urartu]|uniref:Uncharacterized protein n=1 Tax=Triticum urartu TaxID=4572 RepID=M7YSF7_TRIUA|nr:hypothetical protein TRIUR3_33664 [Triticum urartu]
MGVANVEFTLVNMLYGFEWELPEGMVAEKLGMEEAGRLTFHRKTPLVLLATPYVEEKDYDAPEQPERRQEEAVEEAECPDSPEEEEEAEASSSEG